MNLSFVVHSFPKGRMASSFILSLWLLLLVPHNNNVVFGHSGKLQPMIIPTNGWIAIEVITEGDNILNPTSWEIPDYMDGIGAFLLDDSNLGGGGPSIRINVNHEHDDEATVSEININKGKLKDTIYSNLMSTSPATSDFVQSARMAYDKWTTDGGNTWSTNVDKSSTRFCRFCSSQYLPAEAFGTNRGFQDHIYITGEECDDGRLFALDVNNDKGTRDLYVVSGITGSMPPPLPPLPSQLVPTTTSATNTWDDDDDDDEKFGIPRYEEGNGGMPFDRWENAAIIDTGETNHIALLLSADEGSETLKLYIGRKNTDMNGQTNTINFLARNGLLYGRYYYLGGLDWNENDRTGMWDTPPGKFVTDEGDGWSEGKFEDIDTNPNNPTQVVLAESNSGVYILTFNLKFRDNNFVNDADSRFTVKMITNFNQKNLQWPDNVDWTKNNLIFVNKDDGDDGGIWYMNPDGSGKTKVGQTRDGGESTGILDISDILNYPPASTIITTNQGKPSSMTLLLNPTLKQFLAGGGTQPNNPAVVVGPSPTNPLTSPPTNRPRPPPAPSPTLPLPVPPPTLSPTMPYPTTTSTTITSPPAATTAQPPVVSTKPIILPWNDDNKDECPVGSDNVSSFQVFQAEDATLYSGLVKTKRKNYCGTGYVDFEDIPDLYGNPGGILGSGNGIGKDPLLTSKDGIVQQQQGGSGDSDEAVSSRQGIDIVGVSFKFEINYPGMYSITVRYANGGGLNSDRPGTFLVDGVDINNDLNFETTFGWDIWATEKKTVLLDSNSGRHTLDLFWIEVKNRPNLDWLSIELIQQQQ